MGVITCSWLLQALSAGREGKLAFICLTFCSCGWCSWTTPCKLVLVGEVRSLLGSHIPLFTYSKRTKFGLKALILISVSTGISRSVQWTALLCHGILSDQCGVCPWGCPGIWSLSLLSLGHLWPLCCVLGWVGTLSCAPKSQGLIAFALGHFLDKIHVEIKTLLLKLFCFYKLSTTLLISSLKYSFYLLGIAEGVWTPSANWIWFTFLSKRNDHGNYSCSGDGVLFSWWVKQVQGQSWIQWSLGSSCVDPTSSGYLMEFGYWAPASLKGEKVALKNLLMPRIKKSLCKCRGQGQESPAQLGDEDLSMGELEFPKLTGAVLDIDWCSQEKHLPKNISREKAAADRWEEWDRTQWALKDSS